MKKVVILPLIASIFIGCGGSSSGSSSNSTITTGRFVDAPVEGLTYISKDYNGTTNKNGNYECKQNDTISFYAGKIKIGEAICSKLITPLTLADNNKTIATNITYFIQNLDKDKNLNNGIQIPNNIPELKVDFKDTTEIDDVLNNLGIVPNITPQESFANFKNYLNQYNNSNSNNNIDNQNSQTQYDVNKVQVKIEDTNYSSITIFPHKLSNDLGTYYYVGYTTGKESNYADNSIEVSATNDDWYISCQKSYEDDEQINYMCTRVMYIGNYINEDNTDIGDELTIDKSTITYLYEKGLFTNTAYVVGKFTYKEGKLIYTPYEKTKTIKLNSQSNEFSQSFY